MKTTVIVLGLLLLLLANVLMMIRREGFQAPPPMPPTTTMAPTTSMAAMPPPMPAQMGPMTAPPGAPMPPMPGAPAPVKEGFSSYFLENGAGAKDSYEPIGAYDGVTLPTGNSTSVWRYTAPNEKLLGDEFVPGEDSLFMFKNNQCKPECCGASFSCGGGCVCTTPEQRQYIASRGGNRTAPEDSA